jgi:conjugal transfer pilus assembly protein TraW
MHFFNSRVNSSSFEQLSLMVRALALGHGLLFTPVHAEEDWLVRSQTLLSNVAGQNQPEWLTNNPYQAEARQQALAVINASKPVVMNAQAEGNNLTKTHKSEKPLRVLFISFSLGETALKGIFAEASGLDDVLLVLRGPQPQQKLPDLFRDLKRLLKDVDPLPNIVIDPARFQRWGVTSVPEMVIEEQGNATLRVQGVTSLSWLKTKQETLRLGDLGRLGAVYPIAEIDLLAEIKRRLAGINWTEKKHQALARFWKNRHFEILPTATENQDRSIDLTVTAPRDLRSPNGTLIITAGQTVNPLDQLAFGLCVIVFDATEKKQIETARHLTCKDKQARPMYLATQVPREDGWAVLKTLETTLQLPVYLLTPDVRHRFQLQHVPALIEQAGNRLMVRERTVLDSPGDNKS